MFGGTQYRLHQEELRKCANDKSCFEDKREVFDSMPNKHCTRLVKNQIEELTDFESTIQNDHMEPLQRMKTNVFILNKSKCEHEELKETIK